MATLLSCATGNFTSSATWALCDSTAELDVTSSTVTLSTSNTDTGTFTPGAITIDAIALKLRDRAASPTGTMTVTLRNSTDSTDVTSVTVNVSDLPANADTGNYPNGWIVFKFGSSQTLTAGKAYLIRMVTSSNSQVTLWGNSGTNAARQLRTTTTQAPASGDKPLVSGELTGATTGNNVVVTMDNTNSTTFGSTSFQHSIVVSKRGTLAFGTSASTNYQLRVAGFVLVATGGTLTMGTSGTPVPSTSSAILEFNGSSSVDSGLIVNGGTVETNGSSKTVFTTITSTANSGQAVVNVASVTGWATAGGEDIFVTPTERNSSQYEQKTTSSITSLAVTVSSNFSNKHSGAAALSINNPRGHVGMLTYNVKVRGASNSLRGFIHATTNGSLTMRYSEMKWLGSAFSGSRRGVSFGSVPTVVDVQYCSFWNGAYFGPEGTGWSFAWTFSNNVMYNTDGAAVRVADASASVAWTMNNNLICHSNGAYGFYLQHTLGATCTGNICAGHAVGFTIQQSTFIRFSPSSTNISDLECYGNNQSGVELDSVAVYLAMSNMKMWRNVDGFLINSSNNAALVLDGLNAWGNTTAALRINAQTGREEFALIVRNSTWDGETSFAQQYGVYSGVNCPYSEAIFENVVMSQTVAHTGNDIGFNNTPMVNWRFVKCKFGASTPLQSLQGSANPNIPYLGSGVYFQDYNQTAGDHRANFPFGAWRSETTVYHTASPSLRVTPKEASYKLRSGAKVYRVNSGGTVTISVYVRKSSSSDAIGANYNGNQPRLIVERNPSAGFTSDTVLATMTASVGNWELLTGSTGTASADGLVRAYVDCNGTAGCIYVDDWS